MSRYPIGVMFAEGRYEIITRLRGEVEGVWLGRDVLSSEPIWITFRAIAPNPRLRSLLDFSAPCIPAMLFFGSPDGAHGSPHLGIVEPAPTGTELASLGVLEPVDAVGLAIALVDVLVGWSATNSDLVGGLRPETIFLAGDSGERRLVAARPRTYAVLGSDGINPAFPRLSFAPPSDQSFVLDIDDALFTVAAIVWHASTGRHPYARGDEDVRLAVYHDERRQRFEGLPALGAVLEAALVSDRGRRISVGEFRSKMIEVLAATTR